MYTLGSVCGIVAPLVFGGAADGLGVAASLLLVAATVLLTLPLLWPLGRALGALAG